jgi:aspartyl-tRNA(Asn)/glutamyl-tRNA(Gln) amidotransferase subunit C
MLERSDIDAIARLARLELDADEAARLTTELGAILDHMAALSRVPTDGVPPMTHAVPLDLPLRADRVEPSLPVAEALAGAPDRDGDAFRVPAAIRAG